ncbi:MAG TPA: winged helix DNA-binding domain-containing protein [Candidatus Kapabacteria bacterium]|nr:winged helix DNA-binding domain-containing protein [Candidatus Kapabacteria bacterium]
MNGISDQQIAAFRLERHRLAGTPKRTSPAGIARALCGIQAQVYSAAQLGVWTRSAVHPPASTDRALWKQRTLVKTWSMRSTLHLHAAGELPLYLGALRCWHRWIEKRMLRDGVTLQQVERITAAIMDVMGSADATHGGFMTRREMAALVAEEHGEKVRAWLESGWGGMLKHLVQNGLICFGPPRGGETTFVRVDAWLGGMELMEEETALVELARRYLRAYGPASPQDFAFWAGMPVAAASAAFRLLRDETADVETGRGRAMILRTDLARLRSAAHGESSIVLLPYFDTWLLSHRDKSPLVPPAFYKRVYRDAGWIAATVLEEGRVVATWGIVRRGREADFTIEPFAPLRRRVRHAVAERAEAIAAMLGAASCSVSFAPAS